MNGFSLVIADFDEDCVEALCDYFSEFKKAEFVKVAGFVDPKALERYCETHTVDILLSGIKMNQALDLREKVKTTIFLKDGIIPISYENEHLVDRNSPAAETAVSLLRIFSIENKDKKVFINNNNQTKIYSVYSPAGAVGKTSIAVGLAKCFAFTYKTLYVNFEDVPSNVFRIVPDGLNFSDVLCEVLKDEPNIPNTAIIAQNIDESGVIYFDPVSSVTDFEDISNHQYAEILDELRKSGHYDVILVDLSTSFEKKNRTIMSLADKCIVVSNNRNTTKDKIKHLETNIELIGGQLFNSESFREKVVYVMNENVYTKGETSNDYTFLNKKMECILPFDPSIASTGEIETNSKFGIGIKRFINVEKL